MAFVSEAEEQIKTLQQSALLRTQNAKSLGSLERATEERAAKQELEQAAAIAIKTYGNELRGWLVRKVKDTHVADDLFQESCTGLWRGLLHFRWGTPEQPCSLRTWFYKIAFYAICRYQRTTPKDAVASSELSALVEEISTIGGRIDKQNALLECLQQLNEQDRLVILLRQLEGGSDSWKDIARALHGYRPSSEPEIDAEAARLRQRFHRAMEELKVIARAKGLAL